MTAMLPGAFAKAFIETRFEDTLVSAHHVASARRKSSRRCSAASLIASLRFGCDWTGLRPCVAARARIVDAEENRYYLSLKGDLYLYVGSPEPENRFLLCPLERATDEAIDV
jgi:hypothetical protein